MIAEILDRRFVIAELGRIRADLTDRLRERPVRGGSLLIEHAAELADALGDALLRETAAEASAVAAGLQKAPAVRGAADTTTLTPEHVAYLPADALVSTAQSLMEEYIEDFRPELIRRGQTLGAQTLRSHAGGELPPVTANRLVREVASEDEKVRLFEQFSVTDPRWVQSKLSEWFTRCDDRPVFGDANRADIVQISPTARLVLFGDWASGIERAQAVANQMRHAVTEATCRGQQVHVIHLGDTYYSGRRREYATHLLPY